MYPTKDVIPVNASPTTMSAASRGTTSRRTGETPITSIAAISSRIVRAPKSAQTAEPTAAASSSAATKGAPWRITTNPVAAPDSEAAPIWPASKVNWIASVTLIGIVTRTVGRKAVPAINAACAMNSPTWNLPVNRSTNRY
jgi:hypothetical protein